MRKILSNKNFILFFVIIAIALGGVFFDAHESIKISKWLGQTTAQNSTMPLVPDTTSTYINSNDVYILSTAEIKDGRGFCEVIKKLEKSSSSKRIVILSLIISILISIGASMASQIQMAFPWTNTISSRKSVINYIHSKDGQK